MTPVLHLLRHAPLLDPDGEFEGLCYGRLDLPADPAGTQVAARANLSMLMSLDLIRCSPRQRCRSLAERLRQARPGLRIQIDERLAEMDFGRWEGQRWADVDRDELDRWALDFADHRFGGSGDSVRTLFDRVAHAYADCRRDGARELWVTHAGVIRVMRLLAVGAGCPSTSAGWPKEAVPFGVCESFGMDG